MKEVLAFGPKALDTVLPLGRGFFPTYSYILKQKLTIFNGNISRPANLFLFFFFVFPNIKETDPTLASENTNEKRSNICIRT